MATIIILISIKDHFSSIEKKGFFPLGRSSWRFLLSCAAVPVEIAPENLNVATGRRSPAPPLQFLQFYTMTLNVLAKK